IATPPHTHAELTLTAVAAGRHVLCEKPFARDRAEAVEVLGAAEAAGIVHLLGTEFRWDPGQATLARAVASGLVGEPRLVTAILHVPALADPVAQVPPWWGDVSRGGGWLGAHVSQVIDQVRVALGELAGVSASLVRVRGAAMTAEDSFVVHFRLRSGVVGVLQSSAADWGPYMIETRIAGSAGTAWIDGISAGVWVSDATGTRRLPIGDDLPQPQRPEPLPAGGRRARPGHRRAAPSRLGPRRRAVAHDRSARASPSARRPVPGVGGRARAAGRAVDARSRAARAAHRPALRLGLRVGRARPLRGGRRAQRRRDRAGASRPRCRVGRARTVAVTGGRRAAPRPI